MEKGNIQRLQRLEAVFDVLKKGISLCEVARGLGTDHKNVPCWEAFYSRSLGRVTNWVR